MSNLCIRFVVDKLIPSCAVVGVYFLFIYSPLFLCFLNPVYVQKRQPKSTKRKTRQAKALENAKGAPRSFMEVLHEVNHVDIWFE
jgi:hypothetical protein